MAGSADASFDQRFMLVRPRLLAICSGLVGRDSAEDVVHDTYENGRRAFARLRDDDAFDAWICRIAVNQCKDLRRRQSLARAHLPALLRQERTGGPDIALTELIERLPPRERTVLVLHYGHGYGLNEIAGLLAMSHTNVKTVIARTRRRLAEQWFEGRAS
jgi:RNA polymerase sigma-70 factor (ECF subfamily)